MNGSILGVSAVRLGAAMGLLLLFGLAYNRATAMAERTHRIEGYVSLWVVFGVLMTLAVGASVVGIETVLALGLLFLASGGPMIAGSVSRHAELRRRDQERERDDR